jgi:hypothetical protein
VVLGAASELLAAKAGAQAALAGCVMGLGLAGATGQ